MVMVLVVSIPMSFPIAMVPVITVVMFVPRDVFVVVPIVAYEIDRSAACAVLRTMLVPVFLMSRRDVQVYRLCRNILRRSRNHDGLRIDDRRPGNIADIDLPIESRLADADGDANITGKRRNSTYAQKRGKYSFLHFIYSL